jgi:hypothetical protein
MAKYALDRRKCGTHGEGIPDRTHWFAENSV